MPENNYAGQESESRKEKKPVQGSHYIAHSSLYQETRWLKPKFSEIIEFLCNIPEYKLLCDNVFVHCKDLQLMLV